MNSRRGKTTNHSPPKAENSKPEETPPALDAIVDRVLAYRPPGAKRVRPRRGKKS